jgi:ribokinase
LAAKRLTSYGVELTGAVATTGNGVVVSLVDPDGERTMCPDRGVGADLTPADVDRGALDGIGHLHVSGYALFVEPIREAALYAAELARARGIRVSVDLASWSGIRDVGRDRFRGLVAALRPDVVFANDDEERVFGERLASVVWIAKRGARGCSFDGDDRAALPVPRVVDTTGAGDALAAGWILGGPELALEAAARCVGTVGAMP